MALLKTNNVRLAGMAACVPKHVESNWEHPKLSQKAIEEFISTTGIEERRIGNAAICTSDLCIAAAEKLIDELQWDKKEIDIIVFVTQTPDYILPVTTALIQDRLGLSKECIGIDIPLGCSGYVYGMSVLAAMMGGGSLRKGLLMVGDTPSKTVSADDKSTHPLFGDAGAVTAFEYKEGSEPFLFHLGSDGSGYEAIIIPHGGARNPYTNESGIAQSFGEGISRNSCQLSLDGMDVFSFGISQAPKTVNALLDNYSLNKENIDYFVFHQANMMMNKMIAKKLKLPAEKVPYSLKSFGNTSSATIPLTIVTELGDKVATQDISWILCGFGVGLSWGTVYLKTSSIVCPKLVEI